MDIVGEADGTSYTTFEGKYVSGANLAIGEYMAPIDGVQRDLTAHQCFKKCADGCTGPYCYCDGYFPGVDAESSNALCADADLCKYLCNNVVTGDEAPGSLCKSIDMHASLNRCFLNMEAEIHQDSLATDADYSVMVKKTDVNDENGHLRQRRLQTSILAVDDLGFSWDKMLRFQGITFKSGGTFKLCFCDSSLLGSSSACRSESDYSVEVGTIHASGVSCLIAKPELQRVSCVEQWGKAEWGSTSLRCYKQGTPPNPTPPPYAAITDVTASSGMGGMGGRDPIDDARCAMMSEEEASADARCQANAEQRL